MKAIVFHGVGDIRLENVPEPKIEEPLDAIVQLTASAICGTDLHFVRGSMPGVEEGQILGHEGVGIVREVGSGVRNLRPGDRVVIPSTIGCGYCSYCRASYFSQCENANPNGESTAFFGGPKDSGNFRGLQAEFARIPFANVGPAIVPDGVSDEDAILISDIFTTGYFGADMADIHPGNVVAVLGCGPVGQFAIASAKLFDAGRVIAVDCEPSRLAAARAQGAEVVDFSRENPVDAVKELTGGVGADRVIDAVGIDASKQPHHAQWKPGEAPSAAIEWAVQICAKAGKVSVIGVYPETFRDVPFGAAMNKNLSFHMGNCPHRRYLAPTLRAVASGAVRPAKILSHVARFDETVNAYENFDRHEPGWMKVEIVPEKRPSASEHGEVVNA